MEELKGQYEKLRIQEKDRIEAQFNNILNSEKAQYEATLYALQKKN